MTATAQGANRSFVREIDGGLRLFALPALSDNYVWLLADARDRAIAVDPGESAPVLELLRAAKLDLRAILLTHHHPDHIGGAGALKAATRARVYAPADSRIDCADARVGDDDTLDLGEPALQFDVLAVPGHTSSHVAYAGAGIVFSGDALFSVGCGRVFEGTSAQMLASLDRLAALPADTLVCCGHEYTLGNCDFARSVDPDNEALTRRAREVAALRERDEPSVPASIASERACNPFLRVDAAAIVSALGDDARSAVDADARVHRFAELRRRKDAFKAPGT